MYICVYISIYIFSSTYFILVLPNFEYNQVIFSEPLFTPVKGCEVVWLYDCKFISVQEMHSESPVPLHNSTPSVLDNALETLSLQTVISDIDELVNVK